MDPLGLGEETPTREVGLDPLGLGKAPALDPLGLSKAPALDPFTLANELLAQAEAANAPAPPPPKPAPIQRPTPVSKLDPLGLSREPAPPPPPEAPQRLSLERAGDRMTRKMPALEGPPPQIPSGPRVELYLQRPPKPPEPAPEQKLELNLERVGDQNLMTRKMGAIREQGADVTAELPLERTTILPAAPKTRMIEPPTAPKTRLIEDAPEEQPPEESWKEDDYEPDRPVADSWNKALEASGGPGMTRRMPSVRTTQKMPAVRPTNLIKDHTLPRQPPVEAAPPPSPGRYNRPVERKRLFTNSHAERFRRLFDKKARITTDDLVIFTRQFCAMINSGLQLQQSLYFYAESETETGLSKVVGSPGTELEFAL